MDSDFISALQSLGYTEREASFLFLVGAHSGYFLRRQFSYFADRQKGFIAQRFLEKAHAAGHVATIDCGQGFFLYHLFSKPLYRMLGNPDSQNRRRKGDGSIRARLMALDYVLENPEEHYLVSEEDRIRFFSVTRKLGADAPVPWRPFSGTFPISVADRMHPATSLVRFVFLDEGLRSTRRFSRFLTGMGSLFHALGSFELIYTACSAYNFAGAEREFRRRFEPLLPVQQTTLLPGLESGTGRRSVPCQARLSTLLFHYSYPSLQRNEPRGSVDGSGAGSASSGASHEFA